MYGISKNEKVNKIKIFKMRIFVMYLNKTLSKSDEIYLQMSYNLWVQQMMGTVNLNLSFIMVITERDNSRTSDCGDCGKC